MRSHGHAPPETRDPRHRVQHAGVLVPWANSVVEAELPCWAGRSVIWHYARLVPPSGGTALDEGFLSGLLTAAPAALDQLAALPLQRVYLACTSAAFMFPRQARNVAAGARIPVVTAFDAILAALQQRRAGRIVLATPYPAKVSDAEADMFWECGITVTGHATLDSSDGYAEIAREQIRALTRQAGSRAIKEAQAIVLSCTGWPTFGLEKVLRRELGVEVISSNGAIAAHAIQAHKDGS
jgi:maleate isomerase